MNFTSLSEYWFGSGGTYPGIWLGGGYVVYDIFQNSGVNGSYNLSLLPWAAGVTKSIYAANIIWTTDKSNVIQIQ